MTQPIKFYKEKNTFYLKKQKPNLNKGDFLNKKILQLGSVKLQNLTD